jgi:glycerol-3-phosphate dehydrogenase
LEKVVVFGGGSFGTAMAVTLARQKSELQVTLVRLLVVCWRHGHFCTTISSHCILSPL